MTTENAYTLVVSTDSMTPKQAAFREEYKRNIASWYNGWRHFLSIFIPGGAVIWYCAAHIENPTIWKLLFMIPVLVFYNYNGWWLHKNAMHRPIKGLGGILMPVYHRHTHQHHQYFAATRMAYGQFGNGALSCFHRMPCRCSCCSRCRQPFWRASCGRPTRAVS